ncbi:MAG: hypothetical protein ACUVRS_01865 [Armatimonadota bacterium]
MANPELPEPQVFTVTITWSPESEARITEGDLQEVVEQLVMELDEEATVEVEETILRDL